MRNSAKKLLLTFIVLSCIGLSVPSALAKNTDSPRTGEVTPKTVTAGVLSLIIPGIGQAINNDKGEKVLTHVVLGLVPPFHIWSAYDAAVDRKGGYWKGRI
jgi:hypothetical protein